MLEKALAGVPDGDILEVLSEVLVKGFESLTYSSTLYHTVSQTLVHTVNSSIDTVEPAFDLQDSIVSQADFTISDKVDNMPLGTNYDEEDDDNNILALLK